MRATVHKIAIFVAIAQLSCGSAIPEGIPTVLSPVLVALNPAWPIGLETGTGLRPCRVQTSESVITYLYSGRSKLISESVRDSRGRLLRETRYKYSEHGEVVSARIIDGSRGKTQAVLKNISKDAGPITVYGLFKYASGATAKKPMETFRIIRNAEGRVAEVHRFLIPSGASLPSEKSLVTWRGDLPTRVELESVNTGAKRQIASFVYDDSGRLSSLQYDGELAKHSHADGVTDLVVSFDYNFDANATSIVVHATTDQDDVFASMLATYDCWDRIKDEGGVPPR